MSPIAHSGGPFGAAQPLREHLSGVACRVKELINSAMPDDHAVSGRTEAAAWLHDLGKYREGFQLYIRGAPVPSAERHHKQAGAAIAFGRKQHAVAFAVAGHHGGLPDLVGLKEMVHDNSGAALAAKIWPVAIADCPELDQLDFPAYELGLEALKFELETRIIFSCLVDADWSDTAEHDRLVNGWDDEPGPPSLGRELAEIWLAHVLAFIAERAVQCSQPLVANARADVLIDSLRAAELPPGFFSLTVPTGGGKTLSALAFALKHALLHGQRRLIYVAPYLSILDQNADVVRAALGTEPGAPAVFEHHSLSDFQAGFDLDDENGDNQDESRKAGLARRAENWDAPVILTTNVQFFESLFSNRPGACRKFHNIARSVIVLDECQAIPPDLIAPTCAMLQQLRDRLSCSIVLATATQPALSHPELTARGCGLADVREIASNPSELFRRLRRVCVRWPAPDEHLEWTDLAEMLVSRQAALAVVNSRRAARELFQALKSTGQPSVFHLSTWMCPAHRMKVLNEVRRRLKSEQPCHLVSTQLIEAGVDVDFPLVVRELAPLDSVVQAAGRCNREGRLAPADGTPGGSVVVFRSRAARDEPRKYYPPDPWYVLGRDVLVNDFLNAGRQPRIDDPEDLQEYYRRLFRQRELDRHGIHDLRKKLDFPEVARRYRLIQDSGEPVVVATWEEHRDVIERLLEEVSRRPVKRAFRKLAPYQVNVRLNDAAMLGFARPGAHGLLLWEGGYSRDLGLMSELLEEDLVM